MEEIIADEDVLRPIVGKLRSRGFKVFYIDEEMKTADDREVLEKSNELGRPILTFDDDFQEFNQSSGILHITQRTDYGKIVEAVDDIAGQISTEEVKNSVVKINPSYY